MGHVHIKDYPRPQFIRQEWINLNGRWEFAFDDRHIGVSSKWFEDMPDTMPIEVPFTYETKDSGIGEERFHSCVWYRRSVTIPQGVEKKNTILHFQGADYKTRVWVNGQYIGQHEGGYAAFSFDITDSVCFNDENKITVCIEDSNSGLQPRGKQRWVKDSFGCWYVQTTGIWKTVWLEYADEIHIRSVKTTPDIDTDTIRFEFDLCGIKEFEGLSIETDITFEDQPIKKCEVSVGRSDCTLDISLRNDAVDEWKIKYWRPDQPNIYDVRFVLKRNEKPLDTVYSYFGMRKVSIENGKVLLNNKPIYQRLILDQGYWKDSHMTPRSEEALIEDIEMTIKMGFNGVRKHQKTEDARFLYWCDRKGLLVWLEMAAFYEFQDSAVSQFTCEWTQIVKQNYNHPCVVTWVPFNESWGIPNIMVSRRQQQFTEAIYHLTKSIDPIRPVIVNDGWEHTVSDIITLHDYEAQADLFLKRYSDKEKLMGNEIAHNQNRYPFARGYGYKGQPILISEYGGIAFECEDGWGYGYQVKTEEEFLQRYRSITYAIKSLDFICGYCYTQLTDIQQEVNGLLTAERKPKVDPERIKQINMA